MILSFWGRVESAVVRLDVERCHHARARASKSLAVALRGHRQQGVGQSGLRRRQRYGAAPKPPQPFNLERLKGKACAFRGLRSLDHTPSDSPGHGRRNIVSEYESKRRRGISKPKLEARIKILKAMATELGRLLDPEAGDFDMVLWLEEWLQQPVPALGGVRPIEMVRTPQGFKAVVKVLAAIESGAYQ